MVGRKKNKTMSVLMMTHVGEHVVVTLEEKTSKTLQDEESTTIVQTPMQVAGFFLDSDDEFIFLGKTSKEVSCSINKSKILFIESYDKSEYDKIINSINEEDDFGGPSSSGVLN